MATLKKFGKKLINIGLATLQSNCKKLENLSAKIWKKIKKIDNFATLGKFG